MTEIGVAFRIRQGQCGLIVVRPLFPLSTGNGFAGRLSINYDDGSFDTLAFNPQAIGSDSAVKNFQTVNQATKDGWVTGLSIGYTGATAPPQNSLHATVYVADRTGVSYEVIAEGYVSIDQHLIAGVQNDPDNWACWFFQGTVAEDGTVGTHVCTLTISPPAGAEMELLYGQIIATGAAGLVQSVAITDTTGAFVATNLVLAAAAGTYSFPTPFSQANQSQPAITRVSGSMAVVLKAATSTVSDTQTFAVVARIRRAVPSATLADNVGTPTLTTNVNQVF